jgi:multidrug transporter EmrE-like cation transporter
MMNWILLYAAIFFEVAGTIALKHSAGIARPIMFVSALGLYGVSFFALSMALRSLPIGASYAVWSGVGTVMAILFGVVLFAETVTPLRALFISLILVGTIGLNLSGESSP